MIYQNSRVLIQHQAVDVAYCGVLFTYDIQGQRPYYLINYDDTGSTDLVTSGRGGKTLWIVEILKLSQLEEQWRNLIVAIDEIENILRSLDIEFAVNKNNDYYFLSGRPLVANFSNIKNVRGNN